MRRREKNVKLASYALFSRVSSGKPSKWRELPDATVTDIAFVLNQNPRTMWPLEAKVLRTDGTVAPYINDLKKEFLTCRYAPFSSAGAMLGYLISGEPANVFHHLETKVPCELYSHPAFPDGDHRYSEHRRHVPANKPYPAHFRCHHLILSMKSM